MNDCKFLSIEHREGEISPIYHCVINTIEEDKKAIKIKEVYEKKYPHPYLINGECMFCRPDGNMRDCPYYTAE